MQSPQSASIHTQQSLPLMWQPKKSVIVPDMLGIEHSHLVLPTTLKVIQGILEAEVSAQVTATQSRSSLGSLLSGGSSTAVLD